MAARRYSIQRLDEYAPLDFCMLAAMAAAADSREMRDFAGAVMLLSILAQKVRSCLAFRRHYMGQSRLYLEPKLAP